MTEQLNLLQDSSRTIPYEVIRRPWLRNSNIRVEMDDRVIVTVPVTARQRFIREFIAEKTAWINRRFDENAELRRRFPLKRFVSGEKWLLQGKSVFIQVIEKRGRASLDEEGILKVPVPAGLMESEKAQAVRKKLVAFYKERARALLKEPLRRLSNKLGVKVHQLRVTNARSLWGSSTSRGTLSFTNRLAMAPASVLEYLVVHELCHQVHMNHSKAFWALVAENCPAYKDAERWLKETGRWLQL